MPARPIKFGMEFTHGCAFCGWSRPSATSVMLAPSCEHCGCVLDARPADASPRGRNPTPALSPLATRVLSCAALLLAALTLYAAARLGYDAAGPSGTLIA